MFLLHWGLVTLGHVIDSCLDLTIHAQPGVGTIDLNLARIHDSIVSLQLHL